jgi:diguanylate cyclase (GGDEF)-like protein
LNSVTPGSQSITELETQLQSVTEQRSRIDILNELAWALHLDNPEKAWGLAEQAYELATSGEFEKKPYLQGLAGSLRNLSALNNDAGQYDVALTQSLQALEILENIADGGRETRKMIIQVMGNISWTYRSYGDYVVSAEYAMRALKLAQAIEDRRLEAGMLNILSVIYAEANNLTAALEMGQKVLQRYHELKYVRGESMALNNLALTYLDLGDGAQALETCQESLRLARNNGVDIVALTALSTLGEIYLGLQEYNNAEEHLLQALKLAGEYKAKPEEFQCLLNLGKVYQCQQKDEEALSALKNALSISHSANDRRGEFQCHQLLAEVYEKLREFESALQHFKQFHALKETVFDESTVKRLAGLQVIHQVETAKRDAEIHYLKTIELKREIEERKSAQEALEKLASIDSLTGVLNRREFFILGEREVEEALQKGQPLTAVLFDLDHFKQINDTYGHAIGDQFLIRTTKTMRESLRQGEIIGRYGGDEFVILLPGSNCTQGQQVAERLCEKIASQTISSDKGDISVTLSLGISELSQANDSTLETLLSHADQALYEAKRTGRNRLAVYTGL